MERLEHVQQDVRWRDAEPNADGYAAADERWDGLPGADGESIPATPIRVLCRSIAGSVTGAIRASAAGCAAGDAEPNADGHAAADERWDGLPGADGESILQHGHPCPVPVDRRVSDWSDWGECSRMCGGGAQSRTRTVTQQPMNGGDACPALMERVDLATRIVSCAG